MRDQILQAFYILPQTSTYVCSRLIKNLKPSEELFAIIKQLVNEGLLIEFTRYHRLLPVYELSSNGKKMITEDLKPTPYQTKVIEKTKICELEFAMNQQKAYDLCLNFHNKGIYLSTIIIQDYLKLSYIDTICVLAELCKRKELEPFGLLWKIITSSSVTKNK